jgi:multicomponent Na+:H+ antiporter subunit G
MGWIFDLVSWALIFSGSLFALVGGLGIVRLPDFYTRLHGSGVTDTLGAALLIFGLMVQAAKVGMGQVLEEGLAAGLGPTLVAVKLAMILFFLLITSPTGCHALAQAALSQGLKPQLGDALNEDVSP